MKVKICLGEHHGKKRPLFTGYTTANYNDGGLCSLEKF